MGDGGWGVWDFFCRLRCLLLLSAHAKSFGGEVEAAEPGAWGIGGWTALYGRQPRPDSSMIPKLPYLRSVTPEDMDLPRMHSTRMKLGCRITSMTATHPSVYRQCRRVPTWASAHFHIKAVQSKQSGTRRIVEIAALTSLNKSVMSRCAAAAGNLQGSRKRELLALPYRREPPDEPTMAAMT
ncbi:hypothetical protein B0H65DRAFT_441955 [Neurospora tetraspora]|uniref:Secreted protein n=1 Tax=Neurospora tetraspora TaxID=94610 RepID=A0AAE0MT83_9PEZI|nr:hypothetical protein B0H65DRAFT_441955 [Neurospora tetraspora]